MTNETYQGWKNYETWAVALWLDNDQWSYELWRGVARECWTAAAEECQKAPAFNRLEIAVRNLADTLQTEICDNSPLQEPAMYTDLLSAALKEVNYDEIAARLLEEYAEEEEPMPVVSSYSRQQAIADGVLIDVSGMAKEVGLKHPTALTSAAYGKYVTVPTQCPWQDEQERLWDILTMLIFALRKSPVNQPEIRFSVMVQNAERASQEILLKAMCGPGDTPEPVITIMLPEED